MNNILNCAFCHGLKNDQRSPWFDLMTSGASVTQNSKQPARQLRSRELPESPDDEHPDELPFLTGNS